MIKTPYSIADLNAMALKFAAEIEAEFAIVATIDARPIDLLTDVLLFIRDNIDDILTGHPRVLESLIGSITHRENVAKAAYRVVNPGLTTRQVNKWFKEGILRIFNYDFNSHSFSKVRNGDMAYRHASNLNLTTCLYCNAQFTFTIKNKKYKTRPHFDHFFSKSKYPYLALSFFNLIPSCYVCNSNLKGSKPFLYSTHLHPYFESIDGLYRFRTNITSVDFLVNKQDFNIKIEPLPGANAVVLGKAKKSIADFAIEDRYNYHKDYAADIITKSYLYNNSTIMELLQDYEVNGNKLFSSEAEIIELIFGNYIHENKLHKRILSKITKDIAEEFEVTLSKK